MENLRPFFIVLVKSAHGGFDGGTSASDGTAEKTINLAVSRDLAAILRVMGCEVRLTRTEDCALAADSAASIREKKVSDMHARLALYEQAALVVSIHQNNFSQSQYHGAQMFYAPQNAQSQPLADAIRARVLAMLQPDNTRELKRADKSIYLLANTTVPAVLVECGFLSNPAECARLEDDAYQRQIAFAIACGVLDFYTAQG